MDTSDEVRDAMLEFMDRLTAGDVDSFERLVARHKATLVIGTAPGEWVTEPDRLRAGFEIEGVSMTPGPAPLGWADADLGWYVDEPTMGFPDGSAILTRMTAILARGDGSWRLVHMHVSVGVPDAEVADLQRRWAAS